MDKWGDTGERKGRRSRWQLKTDAIVTMAFHCAANAQIQKFEDEKLPELPPHIFGAAQLVEKVAKNWFPMHAIHLYSVQFAFCAGSSLLITFQEKRDSIKSLNDFNFDKEILFPCVPWCEVWGVFNYETSGEPLNPVRSPKKLNHSSTKRCQHLIFTYATAQTMDRLCSLPKNKKLNHGYNLDEKTDVCLRTSRLESENSLSLQFSVITSWNLERS